MGLYFGTATPKKVYFGSQEVKKIYFGTALAWSSGDNIITGSWGIGSYYTSFGNNNYRVDIYVTATEKNTTKNTTKIKVEIGIRSVGNYTISSSTTKNGSITVDGQTTSFSYNCSLSAGQYKVLNTTTYNISNANGKTITVSASLPFGVTVTGVGTIGTIYPSHSIKLISH